MTMPASSATYGSAQRRSGPAKGGKQAKGLVATGARVQWNRLGRIAMLGVMMALLFLYLSTGARMFSTWRQSQREHATVARMEQEHRRLVGEHNRLSSQSALEAEARQLSMMRPGEQSYIVGNLPAN
jgi:cell division protein FtsL